VRRLAVVTCVFPPKVNRPRTHAGRRAGGRSWEGTACTRARTSSRAPYAVAWCVRCARQSASVAFWSARRARYIPASRVWGAGSHGTPVRAAAGSRRGRRGGARAQKRTQEGARTRVSGRRERRCVQVVHKEKKKKKRQMSMDAHAWLLEKVRWERGGTCARGRPLHAPEAARAGEPNALAPTAGRAVFEEGPRANARAPYHARANSSVAVLAALLGYRALSARVGRAWRPCTPASAASARRRRRTFSTCTCTSGGRRGVHRCAFRGRVGPPWLVQVVADARLFPLSQAPRRTRAFTSRPTHGPSRTSAPKKERVSRAMPGESQRAVHAPL